MIIAWRSYAARAGNSTRPRSIPPTPFCRPNKQVNGTWRRSRASRSASFFTCRRRNCTRSGSSRDGCEDAAAERRHIDRDGPVSQGRFRAQLVEPDVYGEARQAAMWLARELTELPLAEGGRTFGGVRPAAVCNQVAACRRRALRDRRWAATLRKMRSAIAENVK